MDANDRSALQDYIARLLSKSTRGVRTRDEFDAARAALLDVVRTGMADVAVGWNVESTTAIGQSAFPAEVLARCFRHIDLTSLVRASCVCRRWRDVALSDPSLWVDIHVAVNSTGDVDFLRVVMRRSEASNLALDLGLAVTKPSIGEDLSAAILEQIHRIRNLTVQGQSTLYLEGADASLLENVNVSGIILPRAKMLRQLHADNARITNTDVHYPNLISVYGDIRGDDFFKACPNLKRLQLVQSKHNYSYGFPEWPRTSAPQTLTHIEITTNNYATEYLATFHGCRALKTVQLHSPCSTASVVELFVSTGATLHRIVLNDDEAHLESDSPSGLKIYTRRDHHYIGLSALPTLRDLTVSKWQNTFNYSESLSCPVLERLTLHVTSTQLRDASRREELMIEAPALQTLVLHYEVDRWYPNRSNKFMRIVVKYLPALLRRLRVSRIRDLIIAGPDFDAAQIDQVDLADIRDCVEHIYHNERELEVPRTDSDVVSGN